MKEVLPGHGRSDEQGVEQDDAYEAVPHPGFFDGRSAHQYGCRRKGIQSKMTCIYIDGPKISHKQNLAHGRKYGGNDNADAAHPVSGYPQGTGCPPVRPHSPCQGSQPCLLYVEKHQAEKQDDDQRKKRICFSVEPKGQYPLKYTAYVPSIHHASDPDSPVQQDIPVPWLNQQSVRHHKDKLVYD